MYIALDSNVLIRDLWMRSQKMRALLDYVSKTPWNVLLLEVVETEVHAHARRAFSARIADIENTLQKAGRLGVVGLPRLDAERALKLTMERWENNFHYVFNKDLTDRLPLREEVAQQAMRRAADRVPPCSERGEGMRDAMIWLGLLDAADPLGEEYNRIAFISGNASDFAGRDKISLREELAVEVQRRNAALAFYGSLDAFLKEHAQPVEHITVEWVRERMPWTEVQDEVREALLYVDSGVFRVANERLRDRYVPAGRPDITHLEVDLADFYVWPFDDGQVGVEVIVMVRAEAEISCERVDAAPSSAYGEAHYQEWISDLQRRMLTCRADAEYDFSVHADGDSLELLAGENTYGSHP